VLEVLDKATEDSYSASMQTKAPIFALLLAASHQVSAAISQPVVSLDLCTDFLLSWLKPDNAIIYSPAIRNYKLPWAQDTNKLKVHNGSLETLVKLNAKIYITGEYNNRLLANRLRSLGHKVKTTKLPLSKKLGDTQAVEIAAWFSNTARTPYSNNSTEADAGTRKPSAMILGANRFVTGRSTYEHSLLDAAGINNWASFDGYKQLSIEAIVANPPDIIIEGYSAKPALANLAAQHPALRELDGTSFVRTKHEALWICPGPWSSTLIAEMRQWRDIH